MWWRIDVWVGARAATARDRQRTNRVGPMMMMMMMMVMIMMMMMQALPPPAAAHLAAGGAGAARGAGEGGQVPRPRALDSSRAGNHLPSYSFLVLSVLFSIVSA